MASRSEKMFLDDERATCGANRLKNICNCAIGSFFGYFWATLKDLKDVPTKGTNCSSHTLKMKRKGPMDRRTEAFVCQQLTAKEWAKILVDKEAGSSGAHPL